MLCCGTRPGSIHLMEMWFLSFEYDLELRLFPRCALTILCGSERFNHEEVQSPANAVKCQVLLHLIASVSEEQEPGVNDVRIP